MKFPDMESSHLSLHRHLEMNDEVVEENQGDFLLELGRCRIEVDVLSLDLLQGG